MLNSKEKLSFEVVDDVDANDIVNLLVNAFDSGMINYWAARASVELPEDFDIYRLKWLKNPESWANVRKVYVAPFVDGGRVILFGHGEEFDGDVDDLDVDVDECECESDEGGERFILDFKAIERGIRVMASDYPRHWADFRSQNDDAQTGDVFIQCCLFGEVIYG